MNRIGPEENDEDFENDETDDEGKEIDDVPPYWRVD